MRCATKISLEVEVETQGQAAKFFQAVVKVLSEQPETVEVTKIFSTFELESLPAGSKITFSDNSGNFWEKLSDNSWRSNTGTSGYRSHDLSSSFRRLLT